MRPSGRGELESLYFRYPQFASPCLSELPKSSIPTPVVIVGAGPIGMVAALTLARFGIRSVLLERKATFNDGSRAICIARPSFTILEQIGAVVPFLAKSLGWRHGRSYYRDREIYRFEMPHSSDDKYLPMYNLQQQYIEQFLWEAISASELIDTRWENEVTGIRSEGEILSLNVKTPAGEYQLSTQYVLAADGAHSPLRTMLGLRLKGENHEGRYVIADVRMDHDFPTERRAFFASAANPGKTVLIHRQPDDIWRIDYQLAPGESEQEAISETSIHQRVGAILRQIGHVGLWDLEWWSTYTANTLCLDDYRHNNVFFIGDSAHIVPIFGVRGLNNGFADAFNLGWKLGYVLNGHAHPDLLSTYTPERRGATLDVFANALKSTRFMSPPSRGWALTRDAALNLALRNDFAKKFADPRQMQPYTYADSPITYEDVGFNSGPTAGSVAPNVKLKDGTFLLDQAGKGFTALAFYAEGGPDCTSMSAQIALAGQADPNFHQIPVAVTTPEGAIIAKKYSAIAGTIYLLRPDLHIAGRWLQDSVKKLAAAMHACLGEKNP